MIYIDLCIEADSINKFCIIFIILYCIVRPEYGILTFIVTFIVSYIIYACGNLMNNIDYARECEFGILKKKKTKQNKKAKTKQKKTRKKLSAVF